MSKPTAIQFNKDNFVISEEYENYLDRIEEKLDKEIKNGTAYKVSSIEELKKMLDDPNQ